MSTRTVIVAALITGLVLGMADARDASPAGSAAGHTTMTSGR